MDAVYTDIWKYFLQYIRQAVLTGLPLLLLFLCSLWQKENLRQDKRRLLIKAGAAFLLYVYGYIVIGITLLCRTPYANPVKVLQLLGTYNHTRLAKIYIVENVLLFLPFGILFPIYSRHLRKWYRCTGLGMLCSAAIEGTQYVTRLGRMETDDLVTNTIGVVIGYICYKTLHLLYHVLLRIWHRIEKERKCE